MTWKRSSGGVIASRFRASAKNGKTSRGRAGEDLLALRGRGCASGRRRARLRAMSDLASAARSRRCAPTTTSAAPGGRAARDRLRATSRARAARSPHERLAAAPVRVVFRHFALKAKHPRAVALARAAEAAALQGAFWAFHDALYADQGRLDDPHLWARCRARWGSTSTASRPTGAAPRRRRGSRRDVREGLRAGVATTPTACADGRPDEPLRMLGYPGSVRSRRDEAARRPTGAPGREDTHMSMTP